MPAFAHQDVLDGGLLFIKNNVDSIRLIHSFAVGDSYATVVSRTLAYEPITSANLTISSVGLGRVLTSDAVTTTSTASTTELSVLHTAFLDSTTSKVVWVTECVINSSVVSGTSIVIPPCEYESPQPIFAP